MQRRTFKAPNRNAKGKSAALNNRRAPPPDPVKQRKAPAVVDAAKKAEETLQKIKDEEKLEAERVRGQTEQKVLSGEIDWLQYLTPKDTRDLNACAEIDEYNWGAFQHNNAMLPKVNELMVKLGKDKMRLNPPTKYVPIAKQKYEEMLFDENFRVIAAVKYLAKREMYPERDYETEKGFVLADDVSETEEIARRIEAAGDEGIDISAAAGKGHADNCTCENRWDGVSERCIGEGVRVRWRRLKGHHFLRPAIVPEQY